MFCAVQFTAGSVIQVGVNQDALRNSSCKAQAQTMGTCEPEAEDNKERGEDWLMASSVVESLSKATKKE